MNVKPMTIGQILDNSFRSYRENFVAILTFTLLLQGVTALFITLFPIIGEQTDHSSMFRAIIFPLYLVYFFLFIPVYNGGMTRCVTNQMQGIQPSFKDLLNQFTQLAGKFVSTNAMMILIVFLMLIVFFIIIAFLSTIIIAVTGLSFFSFNSAVTGAGLVVTIIIATLAIILLFFLVWIWVTLLYPIVEYENLRNMAAVNRAISLAYRKPWRMLGAVLSFYLIYFVIYLGSLVLIGFVEYMFHTGETDWIMLLESTGVIVLYNLVSVLVAPLYPLFCVWLYHDIHARVDGLDLTLTLDIAEENGAADNFTLTSDNLQQNGDADNELITR